MTSTGSVDLAGKTIIVTGGNTDIGYEAAREFAERGARVIIACRNETRGTTARDKMVKETNNHDVHYKHLDLASLASVRAFADDVIKSETRLDVLVNNAGIAECENVKTADGLSTIMQANHFGPFLLTNLLLSLLRSSAPSRIVNVSSVAHERGEIDFQNLNFEKDTEKTYSKLNAYGRTKLCNVLMTVELSRQLQGSGVTVNCLHPGVVNTDIFKPVKGPVKYLIKISKVFFKTPREGAQTTIYLAVSPEVANVSGKYFVDSREKNASKKARDAELARKLWEVSEVLVKLK